MLISFHLNGYMPVSRLDSGSECAHKFAYFNMHVATRNYGKNCLSKLRC